MYKDKASQGGFVWLLDSMLWPGVGENKAKRTTTNMANKTEVQKMILANILEENVVRA